MFNPIEGDNAVLVANGVFRVCPLYERAGRLFAAIAGGFVALKQTGSTSKAGTRIETIDTDLPLFFETATGNIYLTPAERRKPLTGASAQLLLGNPTDEN